jgi:hypothetical protein
MSIWLVSIGAFLLGALLGILAARQGVAVKLGVVEVRASTTKEALLLLRGVGVGVPPKPQPVAHADDSYAALNDAILRYNPPVKAN